jgi:hypothetical protein
MGTNDRVASIIKHLDAGRTVQEIVCVKRSGFNFKHTEGADFLAKVTCLQYEPGKMYNPRDGVRSEWLIPIPGVWE